MLVETEAYGLKLIVPANDSGVSQCLRDNGEFAKVEVDLIASLLGGGVCIDVGANIGSIALPLAKSAKMVIAPCHNCWDAIRDLVEEYHVDIKWSFLKPLLVHMVEIPEHLRPEE